MSRDVESDSDLEILADYLRRVPSIEFIAHGRFGAGTWWMKFGIDIEHRLAWNVVQELGYVLNQLSLNDRLPTVFFPVSPPPYLNGGPREYLSWVIESKDPDFPAASCASWLEGRLPRPVDDLEAWDEEPPEDLDGPED